ncbi:MAG: trypsin-like peptidase domain-containing protein [Planctomycetes bacterium]|nr:trypsin-like peptidase domain-containing protein [Planctomycetota bacterium]
MRIRLCSLAIVAALALPARAEEGLSPETLRRVEEATVLVEVWYRELGGEGNEVGPAVGSGFVVSEDGLVVTNHHVVDSVLVYDPHEGKEADAATRAADRRIFVVSTIKVRLNSGTDRSRQLDAQVLATRDDPHDLALLRTRPSAPLAAFPVADAIHDSAFAPEVKLTQRVWAIGFPLGHQVEDALEALKMKRNPRGLDLSVRDGTVSSLRKDADGRVQVVEHTALIDHGNSGGPLVDGQGRVVGVNTWGQGKVAYAIPIAAVLEEFRETLRLRGATTVAGKAPAGRTLVVEPAGKRGELTFQKVEEALAAARPGDDVVLPEGELTCEVALRVRDGVRLRGVGVDRTRLRMPAAKARLDVGEHGYSEISDLAVEFSGPQGFLVVSYASAETFVHNVRLEGNPQIWIEGTSAASVICAEVLDPKESGAASIVFDGEGVRPRVERCAAGQVLVRNAATPRLDGCVIRGTLTISGGADPLVRGCAFAGESFSNGVINVEQARGTFSNNRLRSRTGSFPIAVAGKGSVTRWDGNDIAFSFSSTGLQVTGEAVFEGNRFESSANAAIEVAGSARIQGNAVLFRGTTLIYAQGYEDGLKKRYVYGFVTTGADAHLGYGGNRFLTWKDWGSPAGSNEGASRPEDLGGNEVSQQGSSSSVGVEK